MSQTLKALAVGAALMVEMTACHAPPPAAQVDASADLSSTQKIVLTQNSAWSPLSAAMDPFSVERPAEINCPDWAFREEAGVFEVDTGACNYLSVSQPIGAPILVGDTLHIAMWHNNLTALEPAEAHAAILVGGDVIWEVNIPIPAPPGAYSPNVMMAQAYPAGTSVVFHLHNHGSNNWRLLPLALTTTGP